jgi:uncharacterized membrane protein
MSETRPPSSTPPPPPQGGGSYTPPPPPGGGSYTPPPQGPGSSSDRTVMLVLSYLGILALVPLLVKKDDSEVQWHAKNGTALFVTEIVIWIGLQVVRHFMPVVIGCGMAAVSCVLWLGFLAISIIAIMKALKGERMRIPVVTDFAEKM